MNHRVIPLSAGVYLCAVPIGNARDVTLRTLDILASADVIASEDTRTTRKLMEIHGVPIGERKMIAYHDHSGESVRDRLMGLVRDGRSVAYVSEAGTPLIADPGYKSLTISGLPSDAFHFAGFLPNATGARRKGLEALRPIDATLVLYESPKRIRALVDDIGATMGADRQVVICRELTKKFEEVLRGTPKQLAEILDDRSLKGEIVVLIARGEGEQIDEVDVSEALRKAMLTMRVKDAATAVAGATGLPRRDVYQLALSLKDDA